MECIGTEGVFVFRGSNDSIVQFNAVLLFPTLQRVTHSFSESFVPVSESSVPVVDAEEIRSRIIEKPNTSAVNVKILERLHGRMFFWGGGGWIFFFNKLLQI